MPLRKSTLIAAGFVEHNAILVDPEDGKQIDCEGRKSGHPDYDPFADFADEAEATAKWREATAKKVAERDAAQAARGVPRAKPIQSPVNVRDGLVAKDFNIPEAVGGHAPGEKKKKVDHNQRAKKYMEELGYAYYRTEHYDARAGRHHDLFGVFDGVAFSPKDGGVMGVQITDIKNSSARQKKIKAWPDFEKWIESGNRAVVLAFRPVAGRYEPVMLEVLP